MLAGPPEEAARGLLGCALSAGGVTVRVTEVEAYAGTRDAASHAFRGRTQRNAVMFGPAGFAYVYFTYGMHWCMNVVCGPDGEASAVLLRAGEVVRGLATARERRPAARRDADLARGPARLCSALGITGEHNGMDLLAVGSPVRLRRPRTPGPRQGPAAGSAAGAASGAPASAAASAAEGGARRGGRGGVPSGARGGAPSDAQPGNGVAPEILAGPRVGVTGAHDVPWRFWYADDPTVSTYRRHVPRVRP